MIACSDSRLGNVPFLENLQIQVDGLFDEEAWKNSQAIQLTPENYLYLIQDKDYIYLRIHNNEQVARYVDLYIFSDSIG